MLYVNLEVNRRTVAAFVDSGAQTTIVGLQTAQVCLPLPPLPLAPTSPPPPFSRSYLRLRLRRPAQS